MKLRKYHRLKLLPGGLGQNRPAVPPRPHRHGAQVRARSSDANLGIGWTLFRACFPKHPAKIVLGSLAYF
jgi:hypothetical protein